jgi:hypothetical protein
MCQAFAENVQFNGKSPIGSPAGSPFDADQLIGVVEAAAPLMPRAYTSIYAAPLAESLPKLIQELSTTVAFSGEAVGAWRGVSSGIVWRGPDDSAARLTTPE